MKKQVLLFLTLTANLFSFSLIAAETDLEKLPSQTADKSKSNFSIEALLSDSKIIDRQEFIESLPEALFSKSNHVLMRRSESPCKSDVSGKYPRTILSDGNCFIAYTGKPGGACESIVEVICKNPRTAYNIEYKKESRFPTVQKYEYFGPGKTPKATHIKYLPNGERLESPTKMDCTRCHGQDMNLIWKSPIENAWTNAYGENAGGLDIHSEAGKEFDKFLKNTSSTEPYRRLKGYSELQGKASNLDGIFGNLRFVPNHTALEHFDRITEGSIPIEKFHKKDTPALRSGSLVKGIPQVCVRCHADNDAEGGYIPFDNESAFVELLKKDKGAYYRQLLQVVSSKNPRIRMPRPPERSLTEDEIAQMKNSLENLVPELKNMEFKEYEPSISDPQHFTK